MSTDRVSAGLSAEIKELLDDEEYFRIFTDAMFRDFLLFLRECVPGLAADDFTDTIKDFLRTRTEASSPVLRLNTKECTPIDFDRTGNPQFNPSCLLIRHPQLQIVPKSDYVSIIARLAPGHFDLPPDGTHFMALCEGISQTFTPSAIHRTSESGFAITSLLRICNRELSLSLDSLKIGAEYSLFIFSTADASYEITLHYVSS